MLKNRFSILSISGGFLINISDSLYIDDPFVEGLKTCLISELSDELPNTIPRPWVPLPPSYQSSQADDSTEQDHGLEANEIIWLHEMLKELVNKYVSNQIFDVRLFFCDLNLGTYLFDIED